MTTRRKTGRVRKKQAAPRRKPAAAQARPARRVSSKRPASTKVHASGRRGTSAGRKAALAPFPTECTIAQAPEMKASLARVLARQAPVTLDLSAVCRIDTAALQVLTAFIRERRAAGRAVECTGVSNALLDTADILGLSALFSPVIDDRLAAPAAGNA